MKTIYLQKNKPRRYLLKQVSILILLFFLSGVVFSLMDRFIISTLSMVWKGENKIISLVRKSSVFLTRQSDLAEENISLRDKLLFLELQLTSLSKNETPVESFQEIAAAVLTRPPQVPYDVILVDAGIDDGVSIDASVTLPEGPILGKVSEVYASNAKVTLFSSSGMETNAVLERHNVPIVLLGMGGGNFKINLPRMTEVKVGDRILSPNLVPRLLAIVREINFKPTDSFQEVLAESPVNIFGLRLVLISS